VLSRDSLVASGTHDHTVGAGGKLPVVIVFMDTKQHVNNCPSSEYSLLCLISISAAAAIRLMMLTLRASRNLTQIREHGCKELLGSKAGGSNLGCNQVVCQRFSKTAQVAVYNSLLRTPGI
jgi:hypothetical protein